MRSILLALLGATAAWCQPAPYLISTVAGGSRFAFPAQATTAQELRLILPSAVRADAAGNIYVADAYYDRILRIAPGGAVTSYAGSETGFGGDGGSPSAARFNGVSALAVNAAGEVFVCDRRNARVRKISAAGSSISTVAGDGSLAVAGNPNGIALDTAGNVFFSDSFHHVVRKVDAAGNMTVVAGTAGSSGFGGDGAAATSARLQSPAGLALDAQGNIYIADTLNHRIRRVNAQGRIDTVAGTGVAGETGDNGPALSAQINNPTDVVFRDGDLFICSRNGGRVRRLRGTTITTVTGGGSGRNFPSSARQFDLALPNSIGFTQAGDLLVLDDARRQIYRVNLAADTIQLAAGTIPGQAEGDNGPAVQAALLQPGGVAVDPDGAVYVSDVVDNRIRRIAPNGVITTFAGTGALGQTTGEGRSSGLGRPRGMAMDRNRNLYVAVTWGGYVRRITPNGQIANFAGTSTTGFAGDGGPAAAARLNIPIGVAVDRDDNVYIADSGNHRIRKVTAAGVISTIAGSGVRGFDGDGGAAVAARLATPQGVAVDGQGNVFIADSGNHRVRRVDRSGTITTVAGTGETGIGGAGGPALQADLWLPVGLTFDAAGNLLIAGGGTGQVRALMADGTLQVVAGGRTTGFSGDGGPALEGQLAGPTGLATGPDGSIYVADTNNERVRKLEVARITAGGVQNRASGAAGPVAAHQIVAIRSVGLGPASAVTGEPDAASRFPVALAGTRVLFDGVAAPLFSVQEGLVVAAAPANPGDTVRLRLEYQGRLTNEVTLAVIAAAPGIYVREGQGQGQGQGQAAARNEDGSDNGEASPAPIGSMVTFTVTGLGRTDSALEPDQAVREEVVRPALPFTVTVGGVAAEVVDARVPVGQTAGVIAVTVRVPEGVEPGATVPLAVQVDQAVSQAGVTIAVGAAQ